MLIWWCLANINLIVRSDNRYMKAFDIGELKKTARVKELEVNRSYSEIHKSPLRSSTQENLPTTESYYLTRWGRSLENREESGWVNVGQGIIAVSVGEEHALILNNKNQCYGYGGNSYGQLGQQAENVTKPAPIHPLKDMKVMAVYCGAYHSFIQNAKGELYSFGFNLKGQLGLGNFEDKKKPVLVHSLLPGGTKNPKASFFADSLSECRRKQRRSKEDLPELANITNLTGYSPLASKAEEDQKPAFLLGHDEVVLKTACGPLHTVVLTNKGRLFTCGYGQKYALGTGRSKTVNEFTEIRVKSSGKIDKIQVGNCSTGYISGGRVWIAGTLGEKVFQNFTALNCGDDVVELKICERNAIMLTRKGDVYQVGEYYREGEKCFTDSPKKVQKLASVKQIWSGSTSFFALSQSKGLYGWGDNNDGQISAVTQKKVIQTPQSLRLSISSSDSVQIVAGSNTTFLLSGQKVESPTSNEDSSKNRGGSVRPSTYLCGPQQKQLLNDLGVQPRVFNCNMEIDFDELIFQSQISEGGYGIIYKGLWRETTVAIKMFKIESESAVRDFFSECAAMEALRHPNVVMFLGACTKSPNFAIVLEYCSRGSLWSNIQNLQLPLSWQQRKRMALQTARGVHYLHSCNPPVLHRDLKSLNLLLDESGRVKLADFGWTKGLDNYMTGKIGTYQWMAPEVIASQKYSEKADVFSYGIILWEIASREPPFKHLTGLQVSLEVLNNDLRPPIPKKTPEAFAKLMRKCWDREPSKRPSFKEVIRELQAMKF